MQGPLNKGTGIPYFFYDREYKMLILAGRGDSTATIYSFDKSSQTYLNHVRTQNFGNTTQKAFCMGPKHCVNQSN